MIRHYPKDSLGSVVINHDNDYGFDVKKPVSDYNPQLSNLSIVIPYFESKNTINLALAYIAKSCSLLQEQHPQWRHEIIIVDDGSAKYPARNTITPEIKLGIQLTTLPKNMGRYYARNSGLLLSKYPIVLFTDSDVIVYPELVRDHLKIHSFCQSSKLNSITFSLFNFLDAKPSSNLNHLFDQTNDFRQHCLYRKSWIGCEEDKQFVGQEFKPLDQTNQLRNWPKCGFFGPWLLPNMVLGGCFAINRSHAIRVGGCSHMFGKYGFEETSLVTKNIANYNSFIIPVGNRYAIHVHDEKSAINKSKKDLLFRKTLEIYFNKYLRLELKHAIHKDKNSFEKIKQEVI